LPSPVICYLHANAQAGHCFRMLFVECCTVDQRRELWLWLPPTPCKLIQVIGVLLHCKHCFLSCDRCFLDSACWLDSVLAEHQQSVNNNNNSMADWMMSGLINKLWSHQQALHDIAYAACTQPNRQLHRFFHWCFSHDGVCLCSWTLAVCCSFANAASSPCCSLTNYVAICH